MNAMNYDAKGRLLAVILLTSSIISRVSFSINLNRILTFYFASFKKVTQLTLPKTSIVIARKEGPYSKVLLICLIPVQYWFKSVLLNELQNQDLVQFKWLFHKLIFGINDKSLRRA